MRWLSATRAFTLIARGWETRPLGEYRGLLKEVRNRSFWEALGDPSALSRANGLRMAEKDLLHGLGNLDNGGLDDY